MEENIGVLFTGSEQHKTATKSRMARDKSDIIKTYERIKTNSPFQNGPHLHNIIDGVTAAATVNVDKYYEIGQELISRMIDQDIFTYEFSRKDQAKNMSSKVTLCKKNDIKCDPALLFQRLLLVSRTNPVDMEEVMSYELSAFPLSLFETSQFLRKADKPKLADAI